MFEYNLPKSKILLPNFERLRVKAIKSLPGEALNSELTRIEQLENCFIQLEKMSFTTPRTKIYFNPVFREYIIKRFSTTKIIFSWTTLLLIFSTIVIVMLAKWLNVAADNVVLPVLIVFIVIYFVVGKILWRCPLCGYRMDYTSRWRKGALNLSATLHTCPNCNVQFK